MSNDPRRCAQEATILRDLLAVDRTSMANERTLLAYIRTGLALAALGASIMQFWTFDGRFTSGIIFLGCGAAVVLIGSLRFRQVQLRLRALREAERAAARLLERTGQQP